VYVCADRTSGNKAASAAVMYFINFPLENVVTITALLLK